MSLANLILGFIGGFVLSDYIVSKYPQAGTFKISPSPQQIAPGQRGPLMRPQQVPPWASQLNKIQAGLTSAETYSTEEFGQSPGYIKPKPPSWMSRYMVQHGVPESFFRTNEGRKLLQKWGVL